MGSFQSRPKITNLDSQDDSFLLSPQINRENLIKLCHTERNPQVPLINRTFISGLNDSTRQQGGGFRVFQWNILSQTLGLQCDSFVKCPKEALQWNYRKYLIIEEIIRCDPDIVCLQEVDHFNFIKKVLTSQGYNGRFFEKPDSPCAYMEGNNGPDGCAFFYKNTKYTCLGVYTRVLEVWGVESNQVAIGAILECKNTKKKMCVVGTHLKARKGALLVHLRNEQVRDLIKWISDIGKNLPVIVCGDFNGEPNELFYQSIIANGDLKLSSAYAEINKMTKKANLSDLDEQYETPYTTWKIRESGEECHTIDYIYFTPNVIRIEGVLPIPTASEIGESRIPSYSYPSDHFALVSDFNFKN